MQTKLLKQIRKRYKITRVDKNASDANSFLRFAEDEYGLPFFILEDNYDSWGVRSKLSKTFDEAIESLQSFIIKDYGEKFRHKEGKSTLVWWASKKMRNNFKQKLTFCD